VKGGKIYDTNKSIESNRISFFDKWKLGFFSIHLKMKFLWHWVISMSSPRVAFQDAFDGKIESFEWTVLLNSLYGVV